MLPGVPGTTGLVEFEGQGTTSELGGGVVLLTMNNGCTIEIEAQRAYLALTNEGRYLEDFRE